MQAGHIGKGWPPSIRHLPVPWEGDSFLEHRDYLASCLELHETVGSFRLSWVHPETHLFDIKIDIPLLHCGWDSLTPNKDRHQRRSFFPFSQKIKNKNKCKKMFPWTGHSSCDWFALLAQACVVCGTLRLVRKETGSRIPGWEGFSLRLPQLLKH